MSIIPQHATEYIFGSNKVWKSYLIGPIWSKTDKIEKNKLTTNTLHPKDLAFKKI